MILWLELLVLLQSKVWNSMWVFCEICCAISNAEKYKELGSNYLQKLKEENPEKLKEYRQRAYQKRKEKMKENETEK